VKSWLDHYGARPIREPLCQCDKRTRLVLGEVVGYGSPLRCVKCYNEVDPALILEEWLASSLAGWSVVHRAMVDLFMDDGDYTGWARTELFTMTSAVNRSALEVLGYINQARPCLYWVGGGAVGDWDGRCPNCSSLMTVGVIGRGSVLICERCNLAKPNILPAEEGDRRQKESVA
jgi:hypothetical protein